MDQQETQTAAAASEGSSSYLPATADSQGPFALYYGYHGVQREHAVRQYVGVLLQHWVLVCAFTVIGVACGAIANQNTPHIYQSTSLVTIGGYIPPEEGPTAELLQSQTRDVQYTNSQVSLLKSRLLARRALAQHPEISRSLAPRAPVDNKLHEISTGLLDQYLSAISYTVVPETSLIRISANAATPELAATIANAHADAFIDLERQQLRDTASINLDYLKRRLTEVSDKLEAKSREVKDFAAKNSMAFGGPNSGPLISDKSRALLTSLSDAVQERAAIEGELRELQSTSFLKDPIGTLQPQFIRLHAAENEYKTNEKISKYHPLLPVLKNEIKMLRFALQQSGNAAIRETTIKYRAITEKERLLRGEFEQLKKGEVKDAGKRLQYELLQNERETLQSTERELRKRLDDAEMSAGTDQQIVKLIDRGVASNNPINLRESSNLLTGGLSGVLLGLVLAFSIAVSNNAVMTVADLKRVTKLSVLGVVPSFGKRFFEACPAVMSGGGSSHRTEFVDNGALERIIDSGRRTKTLTADRPDEFDEDFDAPDPNRLVLVSAPLSRESESFRHIRTTLKLSNDSGAPKIILVTSGQKNDGKTTVAANLAVSFAQASSRVLLIDADLRLPSVFNYFGQPRYALGLRDYLLDECGLSSIILESGVTDLDLLLSGGATQSPAELLSSPRMVELIGILAEKYDHIIIDSPPVAHVTDALLLSPYADALALVVRSGKTPKPVAEFAVHRLRQVNAKLIGAILNDVQRSASYREPEYYFVKGDYYYS